jgi:hypothetical protein
MQDLPWKNARISVTYGLGMETDMKVLFAVLLINLNRFFAQKWWNC